MRREVSQIVDGKRYSTLTAQLLASDEFWDGRNWKCRARGQYLYKTSKGNYFVLHTTQFQDELDYIKPVPVDEAKWLFEDLPNHEVIYRDAFGEEPEEA